DLSGESSEAVASSTVRLAEGCKGVVYGSDVVAVKNWPEFKKKDHVHIVYPQRQTVIVFKGKETMEMKLSFTEALVLIDPNGLPADVLLRSGENVTLCHRFDTKEAKQFQELITKGKWGRSDHGFCWLFVVRDGKDKGYERPRTARLPSLLAQP